MNWAERHVGLMQANGINIGSVMVSMDKMGHMACFYAAQNYDLINPNPKLCVFP